MFQGVKYPGDQTSRGAKHPGGQTSRGAKYPRGQTSQGAKHPGGQTSQGVKHPGGQSSSGAKCAGIKCARGLNVGGQMSGDQMFRGSNEWQPSRASDAYSFILPWCALENQQSPFYVVNEVTLTGQNPSLKFCQPLELWAELKKGLDLLILKIWGL